MPSKYGRPRGCCREVWAIVEVSSRGVRFEMCGIAGAIDLNGRREFSASRLLAMTGAIAHRGPDDEQIHIEPGVALGASSVDRGPGGRPAADQQRGRLDLGHAERRAVRISRAPTGASGSRPSAGDPLRHGAVGAPLRRPRRGDVRQGARPVRRRALGPEHADADPGPRPGGNLSAVLHPGRRLAALGLGDQGAAGLGVGRGPGRPQRHRPVLQHVLRRHDAHVLRRGQVDPAGPLPPGSRRPGRAQEVLGPGFPRRRPGAAAERSRRRWSTSWNS